MTNTDWRNVTIAILVILGIALCVAYYKIDEISNYLNKGVSQTVDPVALKDIVNASDATCYATYVPALDGMSADVFYCANLSPVNDITVATFTLPILNLTPKRTVKSVRLISSTGEDGSINVASVDMVDTDIDSMTTTITLLPNSTLPHDVTVFVRIFFSK